MLYWSRTCCNVPQINVLPNSPFFFFLPRGRNSCHVHHKGRSVSKGCVTCASTGWKIAGLNSLSSTQSHQGLVCTLKNPNQKTGRISLISWTTLLPPTNQLKDRTKIRLYALLTCSGVLDLHKPAQKLRILARIWVCCSSLAYSWYCGILSTYAVRFVLFMYWLLQAHLKSKKKHNWDRLLAQLKIDTLITETTEAIKNDSKFTEAYYFRGSDHHNDEWIHLSLGLAYFITESWVSALADFEKVVALADTNDNNQLAIVSSALTYSGYAFSSLGHDDSALDVFSQVIEINPKSVAAWRWGHWIPLLIHSKGQRRGLVWQEKELGRSLAMLWQGHRTRYGFFAPGDSHS